ncbi:hypothetical protein [Ancylobacter sp. FA202]|uniref:hypothetical protein n=1 Tax=Ancylobacter sp. FA202 TaxID=1111106 RepID=UPI00036FADB3|nr:hypothetical protein [Ancylobacter sp. FA202]
MPGATSIEPPTKGVYVGGLYKPIRDGRRRSAPVNLIRICTVSPTLAEFGVPAPEGNEVSDIDLLVSRKLSASVSLLNAAVAKAGLSGSISDYYEYKIVNAASYELGLADASVVYAKLMKNAQCRRQVDEELAEGKVVQVTKAYVGDIVFRRKTGLDLSGDLSTKAVQATLSSSTDLRFSGKGMIFAFVGKTKTGTGY